MIQTSKPHWGGTRNGKSAIPSAFALRQPWPSDLPEVADDDMEDEFETDSEEDDDD